MTSAIWCGRISDWICLYLARHNKDGLREAEQRLWAATALCIIPPVGLIVWGVGAAHHVHWFGIVFGMGMMGKHLVEGSKSNGTPFADSKTPRSPLTELTDG